MTDPIVWFALLFVEFGAILIAVALIVWVISRVWDIGD